jgi:ABC-2 type transport system ATP-binding protein
VLRSDDPAAEQALRSIPRSDALARDGSRYTITSSHGDLVTDVIHCLADNRIRVTEFRTILLTLEDVFLTLTGRSIRD